METDVSRSVYSSRPGSSRPRKQDESLSHHENRMAEFITSTKTPLLKNQLSPDELLNRSGNLATQASSGGVNNYIISNIKPRPSFLTSPYQTEPMRELTQGDVSERKATTSILDEFVIKEPTMKTPLAEAKSFNPQPISSDVNENKITLKRESSRSDVNTQEMIQRKTLPKVQTVTIQPRSSADVSAEGLPMSHNASKNQFWPNENNAGQSGQNSLQNSVTLKKVTANSQRNFE